MRRNASGQAGRKSIFRSLFAPLVLIMLLQAGIFYFAALYGGIEESLAQNAADILTERLVNRKNEIETRFNGKWTNLDACGAALGERYAEYAKDHGDKPLANDTELQIRFLSESATLLIDTLRHNEVNGVFLILNDQTERAAFPLSGMEQKYGLCIRDMDQESNYSGTEDLLVERAPSSIIDSLGCSLDSWWEAKFAFASEAEGDYYYRPLDAAWQYPLADGDDLAYCSGVHRISGSDPAMLSYSLPLIAPDGYPYGVLGVEVSVKYIASLMPNKELNEPDKSCYVLALAEAGGDTCAPLVGTGALFRRCFGADASISVSNVNATGGFTVTGRGSVELYGDAAELSVYNSNNPFENRRLTLLALVESDTLFAYIDHVKRTLLIVSLLSLLLGVVGLSVVSRRFASPITALAARVRGRKAQSDFTLERLGITEIDELVDAIEELNRNVSRNSARTEFFSRMSHDMRTPMNAIISFSSPELLEGVTETVKDDYLTKIHASGEYLLALINEVLDMTKIESNKTELRTETVRASTLMDTTTPIIEKLSQKKGIAFTAANEIEPGAFVKADVQHINQIVMNLLSNAVKFTPAGGRVTLTTELLPDKADKTRALLRIVVADTGVGMSEEFMQNLYTPFEQENSRQEGTGLGLSIAHKLVELMRGTISCVSRQNEGTAFTVTLPLLCGVAADAEAAATASALVNRDFKRLAGKRILVCEDNAINALIIRRLLEKVNVTIEVAADGQAGADAFMASGVHAFDAILMDVRMPVLDGLATARAIREMPRSDAKTVPIIAMTANAFEEDEQASRAAGMNAHLAKPVEPNKLFNTLLEFLP